MTAAGDRNACDTSGIATGTRPLVVKDDVGRAVKEVVGRAVKEHVGRAVKEDVGRAVKEEVGRAVKEEVGRAVKEDVGRAGTEVGRAALIAAGMHADVAMRFEAATDATKLVAGISNLA